MLTGERRANCSCCLWTRPLKAFDPLFSEPPIRRFYIIKNGKASPEQEVVKATTLQIASRSISTLIKSQNEGELYRIYRVALDGGADFNFLSVPKSFKFKTKEIYDPKYQSALYAEGLKEGRKGIWLKAPPGQAPIASANAGNSSSGDEGTGSVKPPAENSAPTSQVPQGSRSSTLPKPQPVASASG